MNLSITTYRGVQRATIALNGVTLLAGLVGAGKTSILDALRSCVLGDARPMTGQDKAALIHHGATGATLSYGDDQGSVTIDLPSGSPRSQGQPPPSASRMACGLDALPDLTPKERAQALARLLKTEPGQDEIAAALIEAGVVELAARETAAKVIKHGWNTVVDGVKKEGAKHKGAWEAVTGEHYGINKASKWRPDGWTHDLGLITDGRPLVAAVESARTALEAAIKAGGAGEAEMAHLHASVLRIEQVKRAANQAELELQRASTRSQKLGRILDDNPRPEATGAPPLVCPECGVLVALVAGKLIHESGVAGPDVKAAQQAKWDTAKAAFDEADREAKAAVATVAATAAELRQLDADRRAFDQAIAAQRERGAGGDEAAARAALAAAERRYSAWCRNRDAAIHHGRVEERLKLTKVLEPEGLRQRKMVQTLDLFNGRLAALSDNADIEPVTLDQELELALGGRPYGGLSTGEQYLVRMGIQIAIANIEGAPVIIIDIDRPLDRWALGGVVALVSRHTEALALVAVTLTKPSEAPDLSRPGLAPEGSLTYWVEDGAAMPLAEALARRVAA